MTLPPTIAIEIDVKADLSDFVNPLDYYQKKTQDLFDFGVETVIWITTQSEKITVISLKNRNWHVYNWADDLHILPNTPPLNLQNLLDRFKALTNEVS
jgi:hypothetical protein